MEAKVIYSRLISFIPLVAIMSSTPALELSHSLPAAEIRELPAVVSFLVFDSQDAPTPVIAADFPAGTYQLNLNADQVQIRARLDSDLESKDLWVEVELDGQPSGERVELAVATSGVTFALGNALNMDGNPINNVKDPVTNQDAATKAYADAITFVEVDPTVQIDTANRVPKWNGSALISGSLYDKGGNVGVGSTVASDARFFAQGPLHGMLGKSSATTGSYFGVRGENESPGGAGVFGEATSATGFNYGTWGRNASADGAGVFGESVGTGATKGVWGKCSESGVSFCTGVLGEAISTSGYNYGVKGETKSGGAGVFGWATSPSSLDSFGVIGKSASVTGTGVKGEADAASGETKGVWGVTRSSTDLARAVYGEAIAETGKTIGVWGASESSAKWSRGVFGEAKATSGETVGAFGRTHSATDWASGVFGEAVSETGLGIGVYGVTHSVHGRGVYGAVKVPTGVRADDTVAGEFLFDGGLCSVDPNHNIPSRPDIIVARRSGVKWRVDCTGHVWADGTFHGGGADFAESIAVKGSAQDYEAGDVLVIDPIAVRTVKLSEVGYSTLVAGVYATRPGFVGRKTGNKGWNPLDNVPMAIVGVVPCKVSNENGRIERGDLLVTASTPGYAMKAIDSARLTGAVLGKALEPLDQESGVIEVLLALQ